MKSNRIKKIILVFRNLVKKTLIKIKILIKNITFLILHFLRLKNVSGYRMKFYSSKTNHLSDMHSDNNYIELQEITVYGEKGFIKKDSFFVMDHLLTQDFYQRYIKSRDYNIFRYDNPIFFSKNSLVLDEAMVIISHWSKNYYHWILDTLTKLENLNANDSIRDIIMVEPIKSFQIESLQSLNKKYKIHFVTNSKSYFVKKAWVPIAKGDPQFPSLSKIKFIQNFFKSNKKMNSPEFVFLSRSSSTNKNGYILNEIELVKRISNFGFVSIDFNNTTLEYQHNILKKAKVILAPHGASLTNIIFTENNPLIFELLHINYLNACYFNISKNLNLKYYQYIDHSTSNMKRPNIYVDLQRFIPQLESILKEVTP